MKTKLLAFALCLVLMLSLLPVSALAASPMQANAELAQKLMDKIDAEGAATASGKKLSGSLLIGAYTCNWSITLLSSGPVLLFENESSQDGNEAYCKMKLDFTDPSAPVLGEALGISGTYSGTFEFGGRTYSGTYSGTASTQDFNPASYTATDELSFTGSGKLNGLIPMTLNHNEQFDAKASRLVAYSVNAWHRAVLILTGGTLRSLGFAAFVPERIRIAGKDRFQTSFDTADWLKTLYRVERFQNIVVAYGRNFADALGGSYLAIQKSAPILIVDPSHIQAVEDYIRENLAPGGTVYLLGGPGVVDPKLESDLESGGIFVVRLAGQDRFGTNLAILEEAGVQDGDPILVCSAYGFADSLSASAAGLPILLVGNHLNDEQRAYLEGLGDGHEYVMIGGPGAVKPEIEDECAEYGTVSRLGGQSRYETSLLVAERFAPGAESMVLAYGLNFPDGLCGAPLAAALGAPLLLVTDARSSAGLSYASEFQATEAIALGGTALISGNTVAAICQAGRS